jgi:hypothetical protein
MRTIVRALSCLTLCALTTGCAYRHVTLPFDTNFDRTELGDKVGRSSYQSLLWTASWGDAGTQAAATDGDISVIHHADVEIFSILFGLYYEHTTILYGE